MDLRGSYQKLVIKVTDLENEKAELQSELEQTRLLAKYKKTDFERDNDELQSEISELQMLVEDLRTQVGKNCACEIHCCSTEKLSLLLGIPQYPLVGSILYAHVR